MIFVILQIIFLAAWYSVPAVQFVPWWVTWSPSLWFAFWLVTAILLVLIGDSNSTLRSR